MLTETLHEHLQRVALGKGAEQAIAFFDLDRTLIAGYSIVAIARERMRQGLNPGKWKDSTAILREIIALQRGKDKGPKGSGYHRLVKALCRSLKGVSEDSLAQLGEQAYENSIARTLYNEAIALVEAHRRAGHKLVIVTAATRYQAEPIARVLGIDEVCCTALEVDGGKFTGRPLAPLCFGEGKVMAARRVSRRLGVSLEDCWFYSDSSDDLPLLKKVGHPVVVNPSEKLAAHAEQKHWLRLDFKSRGGPSFESALRTLLTLETLAGASTVSAVRRGLGLGDMASANRMSRMISDMGCGFAGIDLEVEGAEHLKHKGPAVFIFNHQSMLDGMVLMNLLKRDVVGLCKREVADYPLLGNMLRQAGTIFVDRAEQDQTAVLRQSLDVLASGRSLVIAPEGTRSTLGQIQPFKHGAFFIAKKAGVPVIPLVLHNVKDALPNGGFLIRPATVRVTVLPPMLPGKIGGVRRACESMEYEYERIMGASEIAGLPSTYKKAV